MKKRPLYPETRIRRVSSGAIRYIRLPSTTPSPHRAFLGPRLGGAVAACLLLLLNGIAFAQNVTWSAQGLPPGISLKTVAGGNARFTGTPTKSGIYNVLVYPVVNGVAGDMVYYRMSILPKNASLPVYYKYSRVFLDTLAGGGGTILVKDNENGALAFTTNGVNFKPASLPASFSKDKISGSRVASAAAGGRFLVWSNSGEMAYSVNQGAFKSLSAPQDVSSYNSGLASDGANRFFLVSASSNHSTFPPSHALRVFTLSGNETAWTLRSTIPVAAGMNFSDASLATHGNTLVLALSEWNKSTSLLRSTDKGNTWSFVNKAPGLLHVAFGNGIFLGTANEGVFKSTDGLAWSRVAKEYRGRIIFSAKEKLFFTSSGVTKVGEDWLDYENSWTGVSNSSVLASSGHGVVFLNNYELSQTYIPTYYPDRFQVARGTVGKPFVEEISLD